MPRYRPKLGNVPLVAPFYQVGGSAWPFGIETTRAGPARRIVVSRRGESGNSGGNLGRADGGGSLGRGTSLYIYGERGIRPTVRIDNASPAHPISAGRVSPGGHLGFATIAPIQPASGPKMYDILRRDYS